MSVETLKIEVPFPTVHVAVQEDGGDWVVDWVDLPCVPLPGDTIDFGHNDQRTVLRREFSCARPKETVVVVARRA